MLALATPSAPPSGPSAAGAATPGATRPAASAPEGRGARDGKDASRFSDIMARQRASQDAATPADGAVRTPADAASTPPQNTTPAGEDAKADDGHLDEDKLAAAAGADAAPTLAQQALAIATLSLQLQGGGADQGKPASTDGQAGAPAGVTATAGAATALTGTIELATADAGATATAPAPGATTPANGQNADPAPAQALGAPLPGVAAQGAAADARTAAAPGVHSGETAHAAGRGADHTHAADLAVDPRAGRQAEAGAGTGTDAGTDAAARPQDDALRAAANATRANGDRDTQADATAPRVGAHATPGDMAQALASAWQAPAPSASANVAAPAIHTPVGQPQWGAELGSQLVLMTHRAGNDAQTAQLRLDPPDLGPLSVTIKLNNGVAEASFVSAHAAVRQAVESALPQLQQSLAQAGISLGQANVSDQGAQAGFGGMNQGGDRPGHGGGGAAQAQADTSGDTVQIAVPTARGVEAGRVDTFA
ncbi:hypothetical protein CAL26_11940 [Bordetella genomosp. 9]|uniref:Flagellar hook-length control protein-like C-terminal domain-containing protein n=2 Tax=Bordetella genomosp. 9 TaxID=1416803 RepID=A0A261R079_9BORD|nr:hypothetical protein CAL26_11940 [Bordetella genomosp. 9]